MTIALGIDTGGTYTDAVLVETDSGEVQASAKSLTTHHDLSIGIKKAVSQLLAVEHPTLGQIGFVGLSTTLATNAIVEGQGSPVTLLLIGYDSQMLETHGFLDALVTDDIVHVQGGHSADGEQVAVLDTEAVRQAVLDRRGQTAAFAVSGYFGVRNPSHEVQAREIIYQVSQEWAERKGQPLPVTCGHELTTKLNSVRRATTAALNARLIPLLQDLTATVRQSLDTMGINAPLMIVKGDGSLVRADWAMRRPIETVLSGPAASVVGTRYLADKSDMWVVDVGGTTTDIAVLRDGLPVLNQEGAEVGGWRTMVEAADVHTVGLGGDSHVRLDGGHVAGANGLTIGPRRVVPLSLLAAQYPEVVSELDRQLEARERIRLTGQFALLHRQPETSLSSQDEDLLAVLKDGPKSLVWLADHIRYGPLVVRQLDGLVARQLVRRAAFTPTDALHVLSRYEEWETLAARAGGQLLALQMGLSVKAFCEQVVSLMSCRITTELVSKVLGDEATFPMWQHEPAAVALLARATGQAPGSDLECAFALRQPLVAVGAPVEAYLPQTADQLRTELVIPRHSEVANAIGAVAGSVVQRVHAYVRPMEAEAYYRLYLPDGIRDFNRIEQAVSFASEVLPPLAIARAQAAGAEQIEVDVERIDQRTPLKEEWGQDLYVETSLTYTAVGRPSLIQSRTN